jgi:hypothetical protein
MSLYVQWDEEHKVLGDEQGVVLGPATVDWLLDKVLEHMKHSPEELENIARKIMQKMHPNMVKQFDFEIYKGK